MTATAVDHVVRMGEFEVAKKTGTLVSFGLGSCVAVILYDAELTVGGLAHVLLPSASLTRDQSKPARSAETAIPILAAALGEAGADLRRVRARLVGGASMFASLIPAGQLPMGERNIVACRLGLRRAAIPLVAEAVGGDRGRSVWFDVANGVVTVRSVGCESAII